MFLHMLKRRSLLNSSVLIQRFFLTLAGLILIMPVHVSAQSGATIEEIVVTSRKREENLMDIPGSITVLSDVVIDTANIASIRDFADLIPNLTIIDQLLPSTPTIFRELRQPVCSALSSISPRQPTLERKWR